MLLGDGRAIMVCKGVLPGGKLPGSDSAINFSINRSILGLPFPGGSISYSRLRVEVLS